MVRTVIPIFTTSSTATLALRGHRRAHARESRLLRRRRAHRARLRASTRICAATRPTRPTRRWSLKCRCEQAGDVRARLLVRALEIMESCRILRQALTKMPPGEYRTSATASSTSSPAQPPAASKRRAAKSCTASRWKEGSPQSGPRPRAHAHVRQHARRALDGAGRAPGRHAADPGLHRSLLLLHRPVEQAKSGRTIMFRPALTSSESGPVLICGENWLCPQAADDAADAEKCAQR